MPITYALPLSFGLLLTATAPLAKAGSPTHADPATAAAPASEARPLVFIDPPEVQALGKQLRCPVCQGMPIGESPSDTAHAMMKRIRELYAEGKTPDQIREYFVARYGEWVLLEPKSEGFGMLVWVLPPIALALALGVLALIVKKNRATPTPTPTPTGAGAVGAASLADGGNAAATSGSAPKATALGAAPAAASAVGHADDDYLRQVRETIERGDA